MTRAPESRRVGQQQEKTEQSGLDRSPAQFFFETGFFAAFAEACAEIGKAPFALSDRIVERAWDVAGEAHDDRAEFDAYLARANGSAAPNTPASNDFVLTDAMLDAGRFAYKDGVDGKRGISRQDVRTILAAALAAAPASPEPANEPHGLSVIDAAAARELFLSHCKPGDRGTLERYGERAAIAAIMEAVSIQGASPEPASNEAPGRGGFIHARTFDTRWGQALAFLNQDDDYDTEVLVLRVWAPLCEDGSRALVDIKIGLKGQISDEAADAMEEGNRSALLSMDAAKFEAAIESAGIASHLDAAFERFPA